MHGDIDEELRKRLEKTRILWKLEGFEQDPQKKKFYKNMKDTKERLNNGKELTLAQPRKLKSISETIDI